MCKYRVIFHSLSVKEESTAHFCHVSSFFFCRRKIGAPCELTSQVPVFPPQGPGFPPCVRKRRLLNYCFASIRLLFYLMPRIKEYVLQSQFADTGKIFFLFLALILASLSIAHTHSSYLLSMPEKLYAAVRFIVDGDDSKLQSLRKEDLWMKKHQKGSLRHNPSSFISA